MGKIECRLAPLDTAVGTKIDEPVAAHGGSAARTQLHARTPIPFVRLMRCTVKLLGAGVFVGVRAATEINLVLVGTGAAHVRRRCRLDMGGPASRGKSVRLV